MKNKLTILNDIFGYTSFRPKQEEIIDAAINNGQRGTLVVMPTGGGKSLLFQIPSIMQDGLSVVVSPLISLMKDQIDELNKKGICAKTYNSSLNQKEKDEVIGAIRLGYLQILYIAPERFDDDDFVFLLKQTDINVFAVDESHSISQMGHDFRPSYRRLKKAIEIIKPKQIIAVTATANPTVQRDICIQLGIPNAELFITGFFRDNLSVIVKECSEHEKYDEIPCQVSDYNKKGYDTGIIYVSTRKNAELLTEELTKTYNIPATFYHAGMKAEEREIIQDSWFKHGGNIVATTAFGMGINKSNVRYVIHANMPGNLSSWYQEIGRAGRDGKLSVCKMYVDYKRDVFLQNFFINMSCPPPETVRKFWNWVFNATKSNNILSMSQKEMAEYSDIEESMVSGCVSALRYSKILESEKRGSYLIKKFNREEDAHIDWNGLNIKRKQKTDDLKQIINFCKNTKICRMIEIQKYFGDNFAKDCGKCDICRKKNINTLK